MWSTKCNIVYFKVFDDVHISPMARRCCSPYGSYVAGNIIPHYTRRCYFRGARATARIWHTARAYLQTTYLTDKISSSTSVTTTASPKAQRLHSHWSLHLRRTGRRRSLSHWFLNRQHSDVGMWSPRRPGRLWRSTSREEPAAAPRHAARASCPGPIFSAGHF